MLIWLIRLDFLISSLVSVRRNAKSHPRKKLFSPLVPHRKTFLIFSIDHFSGFSLRNIMSGRREPNLRTAGILTHQGKSSRLHFWEPFVPHEKALWCSQGYRINAHLIVLGVDDNSCTASKILFLPFAVVAICQYFSFPGIWNPRDKHSQTHNLPWQRKQQFQILGFDAPTTSNSYQHDRSCPSRRKRSSRKRSKGFCQTCTKHWIGSMRGTTSPGRSSGVSNRNCLRPGMQRIGYFGDH